LRFPNADREGDWCEDWGEDGGWEREGKPHPETEAFLHQYFPSPYRKALHEYDFGDGWEHEVLFEKTLIAEGPIEGYPVCLKGCRACPPEDIGGVGGYEELVKAVTNPDDPVSIQTIRDYCWEGIHTDFKPDEFDPSEVHFRGG